MFDIPPYTTVDLSDPSQKWSVVCEAEKRATCEDYLRTYRLAECGVFKESGEERYRAICKVIVASQGGSHGKK